MAETLPREYSFSHAPGAQAQLWMIREGHLLKRGGARALNLAQVQSAEWTDVTYRGTQSLWLRLRTDAETVTIACSDTGEARADFLDLIGAVSDTLSTLNPDLKIAIDMAGPWRAAVFGLCVILGGLGIYGLYDVGVTNSDTKPYGLLVWISVGILVAVYFAFSFSPWRSAQHLLPAGLSALLRDTYGASVTPPQKDTT